MKCNSCGTENNDNEKFCKKCGMQLNTEEKAKTISEIPTLDESDEPTATIEFDDSEANTTVLTSELRTPGLNVNDSEANTTVLTSELRTPGLNANPANNGGRPMPPQAIPQGFAPAPGADMPQEGMSKKEAKAMAKAQKEAEKQAEAAAKEEAKQAKKAAKGKKSVGVVVALVLLSLISAAGITMFVLNMLKINNLNDDLASATDANEKYSAQSIEDGRTISEYQTQVAQLSSQTDADAATIASMQEDLDAYAASSEHYAQYNGLIAFADENSGTSNKTFFASDTVLHMAKDEVEVYVYVEKNSDLSYVIENTDVATCEWVGWETDNVAILKVTPGATIGSTKITLTNGAPKEDGTIDENTDETAETTEEATVEEIVIFVYNN